MSSDPIPNSSLAAARLAENVMKLTAMTNRALADQVLKVSDLPKKALADQALRLSELPTKALASQVLRMSEFHTQRVAEQALKVSELPTKALAEQALRLSELPSQALAEQILHLSDLPRKAMVDQMRPLLSQAAAIGNDIAMRWSAEADRIALVADSLLELQASNDQEDDVAHTPFEWDATDTSIMWWSLAISLALLLTAAKESSDELTQTAIKYVIGFLATLALINSFRPNKRD